MGNRLFFLIIVLLLLPFHIVQAVDDSNSQASNIYVYEGQGTMEQIRNVTDWIPLNEINENYDKALWLKVDFPEESIIEPFIYLNSSPAFFEVFQGGALIYKYGEIEPDPRVKNYRRWDLIPLHSNEPVYIHLNGNIPQKLFIMSEQEFLKGIIHSDLSRIIGNIGLIIMAFFSFIFYLFNRENKLTIIFTGFTLSLSIGGLLRLESKQFLLDQPLLFFYVNIFISAIGPLLFILFFSKLLDTKYKKFASWTWKIYGTYCFFAILVMTIWPNLIVATFVSLNILLMGSMLAITTFMILSFIKKKNKELLLSILGVAGFILVYLLGALNLFVFSLDIGLIANYILVTACISIIINQYIVHHRKVQRYSEELEIEVQERTANLESALQTLKETQSQLVEGEKMRSLGDLVAGVAHEINTPLGISITASSHLSEKTKEITESYQQNSLKRKQLESYIHAAEDSLSIIEPNLQRAADLIRSFKQVAVDQSSNHVRKINLKDYVEEVIQSLKPAIKRNKCRVTLTCDENIEISCIPGNLSQIVTNLMINSITHAFDESHTNRLITIDVTCKDETIVFVHSDNGKGMDDETKSQIFEPFFTTKRNQGGSGLGLHIVYNIVNQSFKGLIKCEGEINKGTTFTITFPKVRP